MGDCWRIAPIESLGAAITELDVSAAVTTLGVRRTQLSVKQRLPLTALRKTLKAAFATWLTNMSVEKFKYNNDLEEFGCMAAHFGSVLVMWPAPCRNCDVGQIRVGCRCNWEAPDVRAHVFMPLDLAPEIMKRLGKLKRVREGSGSGGGDGSGDGGSGDGGSGGGDKACGKRSHQRSASAGATNGGKLPTHRKVATKKPHGPIEMGLSDEEADEEVVQEAGVEADFEASLEVGPSRMYMLTPSLLLPLLKECRRQRLRVGHFYLSHEIGQHFDALVEMPHV